MSTRARRSKSQASTIAEGSLSVLDKLLLAQAVWELGSNAWSKVSKLLAKHPLLSGSHPKTFFTSQSCHTMYNHLMNEANLEITDANNVPHAPTHLKLAEKYYAERVDELRTLISAEEQQFKAIVAEIDQIRAGQRDEEIKARIAVVPLAQDKQLDEATEEPEDSLQDENVPASAVTPTPALEVPQVETEAPEPDTLPEVDTDPRPLPPAPDTTMEDVETLPVEAEAPEQATVESSPPPEALSSPAENLDHLMQASDDELPDAFILHDVEVSEPVVVEDAFDIVPEKTEDQPVEVLEDVEPTPQAAKAKSPEMEIAEAESQTSKSKPVSRNSEASAPEGGPAEEVVTSTRRSTRRRPSITTAPASAQRKRGRRPQQKSSPEPEPDATIEPTPTTKEETPLDEPQQQDEGPIVSAAIRRRESKRKASFFGGLDSPRDKKRAREDSEPVDDDEQGSGSAVLRRRGTGRTEEQVALKRFQTVITMVHSQISQHRNGNIFHNPIKTSEAPDYHDIVKRPIDLKTIKAKIKDGVIGNSLEYQRDIYLMFANAMMYNRPGSDVHVMAGDMMVESDSHINTFRQTEGYVRGSRI